MLLFSVESGFCLRPKLGEEWVEKGTQPTVLTKSQHQKRLNVSGYADPIKDKLGMIKQPEGNTDGFLAMLSVILKRYKAVVIELWVDQANWYRGKHIVHFLSCHKRLSIEYIPKYHLELNFQEQLWRIIHYEETTNTYYEVFDR